MDINQSPQINYCSSCGHPVDPGSFFCSNCGTQLNFFSNLNPKSKSNLFIQPNQANSLRNSQVGDQINHKWSIDLKWLAFIPFIIILIFLIVRINTKKPLNSFQKDSIFSVTQPTKEQEEPNNYLEFQLTITSVPISTGEPEQRLTTTVKVTTTSSENNNSNRSKPTKSCPGAPIQRLKVGDSARVCTKSDNVYVRKGPSKDSNILTSVAPGEFVKIIGGPECANNWSYWEVEIGDSITGWISEGGDKIDPYFLCPDIR